MNYMVSWLENHDKLAGWAQFAGAILALLVTYFTAFAPHWRRKRQLRHASERLLAHGYESLESFHRTTAHFLPQAINLKAGSLMIRAIIDEMDRFPIYELDDQGNNSTARRLVAVSTMLEGTCLLIDDVTERLGQDIMAEDDRDFLREWVGERLEEIKALLSGATLKRPSPADFIGPGAVGERS